MLSIPAACATVRLGKSAFYVAVAAGMLPKPVFLGARVSGVPEAELTEVLELRAGGGTDADVKRLVALQQLEREKRARRILDRIEGAEAEAAEQVAGALPA